MSSFVRTIQRRILRSKEEYVAPTQPTITYADGSYRTLTNRGWQFFSARRLAAQARMADLLGGGRAVAAVRKEPRDYRGKLTAPGRTAVLKEFIAPAKPKRVRSKKEV